MKLTRARIIGGTAAGAAVAALPRIGSAQTLEKIRIAGVPTDDISNIVYAIQSGMYRRAGLDVELVPISSGAMATQAIITGAYQLGKGSSIASLVAHLRKLPLTIVGNGNMWNPKSPISQMLVSADSTVKTGADLNSQTLGSPSLNDLNLLSMKAWIDKNDGDSSTVKSIELPNSIAAAAIEQHRVAAAMLQEPQLSAALATRKVRELAAAYSAIADHFAITVYFANAAWAKQHVATLKKWLNVTYAAAAYTNRHHAQTAPMMAAASKIPLDIVQKMYRCTIATSTDPTELQPVIDLAAKYGMISRAFQARDAYFIG